MDFVLNIMLAIVDVIKNCLCNPTQEPFEFPIQDNCYQVNTIIQDCLPKSNLCELKKKVIFDFQDIVNKLECGIQPDLEFILEEISLIYIYDE